MNNLAYNIYNHNNHNDNIIVYDFKARKQIVEQADVDDSPNDNRAGQKKEVYAFRTDDEIKAMIDVYDKHIEASRHNGQLKMACRNKMLFVIGINIGVRASDLRLLTWDFFFEQAADDSLRFRKSYSLRPRKTRKSGKHVNLYFNDAVKKIINWYINLYPIENINDYVFRSRRGNEPITVNGMWRVIKDAAKEAGIEQNVGSHSLRKTFSRRVYDNAQDKSKALVILQNILNHSDQLTTMRYLGLINDEIEETFDDLNIGIDMI